MTMLRMGAPVWTAFRSSAYAAGGGGTMPRRWDRLSADSARTLPTPFAATPRRRTTMAYTLPSLPYAPNALEPSIDTMTMEIHHGRHHKAYVDNLNKALEGHANLASKPIEQLLREISQVPEAARQAVINNGGGHANHSMFWEIMAPGAGGDPTGPLAD